MTGSCKNHKLVVILLHQQATMLFKKQFYTDKSTLRLHNCTLLQLLHLVHHSHPSHPNQPIHTCKSSVVTQVILVIPVILVVPVILSQSFLLSATLVISITLAITVITVIPVRTVIPKALKWNCGIYTNFILTNINTIFFVRCFTVSHLLLV